MGEDNTLNQLVAEGTLARMGYEVHTVANGAEALDAIAARAYSAILMDCHMPVMDGFTATGEIRRREAGRRRSPVIAMTAGAAGTVGADRVAALCRELELAVRRGEPAPRDGLLDALEIEVADATEQLSGFVSAYS